MGYERYFLCFRSYRKAKIFGPEKNRVTQDVIRVYAMTSILDPSNLSQTPILESILERPTFYFTETVKFRLFQQFPNPYFILAFL